VDATGALQAQQYYYPYGANRGGAQSDLTDKRFTGQYHESGLAGAEGLYYYSARWYDPALARFAQADTLVPEPGNPQALNRYAYVYNNPARYTDPSGHDVGIDPIKYPQSKAPPSWSSWRMESGRWKWASSYNYREDLWLDSHRLQEAGKIEKLTKYYAVRDLLDSGGLRAFIGGDASAYCDNLAYRAFNDMWDLLSFRLPAGIVRLSGPDNTSLVVTTLTLPGTDGITIGNTIVASPSRITVPYEFMPFLNHEYTHVLQYRAGATPRDFLEAGLYDWSDDHPYEGPAMAIEHIYSQSPGLPPIWTVLRFP